MIAVGARALLIVQFVLCAVLIATLANVATSPLPMLITTMALGICVQGAQAGLNALAAMFYPTSARATGIGWALGVGRIGSIVGPSLGGILLSMHWTPKEILIAGIAPATVAAFAIAVASALPQRANAFRS
jgi:AAHS family 4-hydroxybenzoate transporter-like MFS transporter